MKGLDTSLRLVAGRTVREVILIGSGVGSIAAAVALGDRSWNVYVYAIVTALFAARFFAARVLYLSLCVGAFTLQAANLMRPAITLAHQAPVLLQILGLAALLCGPDLIARFDDHGRGLGPLRNFWRDLSVGQRRHLAWGMHLVGATGGLLHHTAYNLTCWHQPVAAWLDVGIAACAAVGVLYLAGRAVAAPAAVVLGAALTWQLAPRVPGAIAILRGHPAPAGYPIESAWAAHYTIMACACAAATALVALPWAWRWLRLAWR